MTHSWTEHPNPDQAAQRHPLTPVPHHRLPCQINKTRTQHWKKKRKKDATTPELHLGLREDPVANMGVCILMLLPRQDHRGAHTAVYFWQLSYYHFTLQVKHNTLTCHSNHTCGHLTILECVYFQLPEFILSGQSNLSLTVFLHTFTVQMQFSKTISGLLHTMCALSALDGWTCSNLSFYNIKITFSFLYGGLLGWLAGWQTKQEG